METITCRKCGDVKPSAILTAKQRERSVCGNCDRVRPSRGQSKGNPAPFNYSSTSARARRAS